MSNLNLLISKIIEDAESKAKELLDAAEKEKVMMLDASKAEAKNKAAFVLNKAAQDAAAKKARIISSAQLEIRNESLEAKQIVIDKVFDKAVETLLGLPDDHYLNMMMQKILELPIEGNEELIISERDKERVGDQFLYDINQLLKSRGKLGELSIRPEFGSMKGGFIVAKNGIEMNLTIEALVFSLREEMEKDLADFIFKA